MKEIPVIHGVIIISSMIYLVWNLSTTIVLVAFGILVPLLGSYNLPLLKILMTPFSTIVGIILHAFFRKRNLANKIPNQLEQFRLRATLMYILLRRFELATST